MTWNFDRLTVKPSEPEYGLIVYSCTIASSSSSSAPLLPGPCERNLPSLLNWKQYPTENNSYYASIYVFENIVVKANKFVQSVLGNRQQ